MATPNTITTWVLSSALVASLSACQIPASPRALSANAVRGGLTNVQAPPSSLQASGISELRGHAEFPAMRTQATPAQVINRATLTLSDLSTNTPLLTGQTDALGNFSLALNGFAPVTNGVYLLEASKGLNSNAAGSEQVRMRTFLKWNGTGWLSMTNATVGGTILLNSLTTALALISNLDPTGVDPANTTGKVNGTTLNASPAYASHSNTEISALASSLTSYLGNNLDPVAGVSGILPNITGISPPSSPAYRAVLIAGSGFSPLVGGNTVVFGGGATASVYVATPTALYVVVPSAASTGTVTVKTGLGTSNAISFTVDSPNAAPTLTSIDPSNAAPGDMVTLTGEGFSPTSNANTVTFQTASGSTPVTPTQAAPSSLIVQVPSGAVSGAVTVTVGSNTSNRFYLGISVPRLSGFNPTSGSTATTLTVTGGDFGPWGILSRVKFNGVEEQARIVSWSGTQAQVYPPPPSLLNRVSGPISLASSTGLLSASFGSFTARTSLVENFASGAQTNSATTASWGGGSLQMGPVVTLFSQSGDAFEDNTNTSTTGMGSNQAGLGVSVPVLPHPGNVPVSYAFSQLGVDTSSYYVVTGSYSDNPTISRFALKDGSLLGTSSRAGITALIWDRANDQYVSCDSFSSPIIRTYRNWNDTAYLSQGGNYTAFLGANGTSYFLSHLYGPANVVTTGFNNVLDFGVASDTYSAAGLAGSGTFYCNQGNTQGLSTYTTSGNSGTVNLPFAINPPPGKYNSSLGSDGRYLYMLGTNPGYNGGATALFKLTVNGSTVSLAGTPSGTSVTAPIARPANCVWDAISINKTVPSGTTCTVDVLDGTTNAVLLANVASGQSLNSLSAATIKLRATLTGTTNSSPTLSSWSVATRGNYALSTAYDSGTNFATYEAPTVTATSANYTLLYSDSADGVTWGSWVSNVTTLSRRYIRYQIVLTASNTQLTGITIPYQY